LRIQEDVVKKPHLAVLCLILLGASLAILPSWAEQNVRPGINSGYIDPNVSQWRGVFERDGREIWDRRADIIQALRLRPGQVVADIGAGTGFIARMMAREVLPGGRVYAVDIAKNFVDSTVQRARDQGLNNVIGVVNDQRSINLPDSSIDLAFSSDTYHHFEYPQSTLRSIHRALRPDGEFVVIDFIRIPGVSSPWVLGHVRAGEEVVTREIEAAGFELIERLGFMQTQYYLRFRKRTSP
jgi:ubiquinone/menaquinone biosynthesis C-methylase UbiE